MSYKSGFDWTGFFVHFVFGSLIGAAIGFGVWVKSSDAHSPSAAPGLLYIGGAALICGVIAGFLGDRFWHNIGDWFRGW